MDASAAKDLANAVGRLVTLREWKAFVRLLEQDDQIQIASVRAGEYGTPQESPPDCLCHNERIRKLVRSAVAASDLMQDPAVKAAGFPDPFSL